ncbi:ankyrin repeat domain-containing protein [Methylibium sp.]|uniref:ankyrin repeat domain-containing protein n=1 Tax=Methylibium sp. TaxID=2067992 RepID=UPI003D11B159
MNDPRRFQRLSAQDLPAWLAAHPEALLLDAREARHHEQGHLSGCLRLDGRNHERLLMREPKDRPVFIYCYHGNASRSYAQMFVDFGFHTVFDLVGGWEAWQQHAATPPSHDTQGPGEHGNTPLMQAAWRGDTAGVEALLAQGASLTATNGDGNNALWLACVANDPALVTLLVRAGVPIDHQNLTGATCLMYAASSSKPQVVRTLLELGADPHLLTQDDYTALDMAASVECLQLLRTATRTAA